MTTDRLTHIAHDAIGGLPGMVLTMADVGIAAAANAAQASIQGAMPTKCKTEEDGIPGLDILGPRGTQAFPHSLRHFMRRDKFQMRVKEGEYHQRPGDAPTNKPSNINEKGPPVADPEVFYVQTVHLPLVHRWSRKSPTGASVETQVLSYCYNSTGSGQTRQKNWLIVCKLKSRTVLDHSRCAQMEQSMTMLHQR